MLKILWQNYKIFFKYNNFATKIFAKSPTLVTDEQEVKCLIIYPEPLFIQKTDSSDEDNYYALLDVCNEIKMFRNIYKICVKLPVKR